MGPDFILLYQLLIDDIRDWKRQQWLVATTTATGHMALVGTLSLLREFGRTLSCSDRWALGTLAWLAVLGGIATLWKLHAGTHQSRQRLLEIERVMPEENKRLFMGWNPKNYGELSCGVLVPVMLTAAISVSGGLVTWIVMAATDKIVTG